MFAKASITAALLAPLVAASCKAPSSTSCAPGTEVDEVSACAILPVNTAKCGDGEVEITFAYEASTGGTFTEDNGVCVFAAAVDPTNAANNYIMYDECLTPAKILETCGFDKDCPVSFCTPEIALKSTIRFGVMDRKNRNDLLRLTNPDVCATADSGTAPNIRGYKRHFDNQDSPCDARDSDFDGVNDCDDVAVGSNDEVVGAVRAIGEQLEQEMEDRVEADDALEELTAEEVGNRVDADQVLADTFTVAVNSEAAARISGDEDEAAARMSGDVDEAAARMSGDVDEAGSRVEADEFLADKIDTAVDALEDADAAEALARATTDEELQVLVQEAVEVLVLADIREAEDRAAADEAVEVLVQDSVSALIAADEAEKTARAAADEAEQTARAAADEAEKQLRTDADEAEKTAREVADAEIQDVIDSQQSVIISLQNQIMLLVEELAPGEPECAADYEDLDDEQLLIAYKAPIQQGKKACRVVECETSAYSQWLWWKPYKHCACRYAVEYATFDSNYLGRYGHKKWNQREGSGCIQGNDHHKAAAELRELMFEDKCFGFPCPVHEARVELEKPEE